MDLVKLCQELISINSVTIPEGTREIVGFLKPICQELGCSVQTQELDIYGHKNLNVLATIGPADGPEPLLVNTHLDTVHPGAHAKWTRCNGNPFAGTIDGDWLYGLGSADTKLSMACAMIALERVIAKKSPKEWRNPLHLLGCAGEELGLLGAKHVMETQFVNAKYCVDSEPSELNIVWAHKGICVSRVQFISQEHDPHKGEGKIFKFSFTGEAAHSSTPHLGKNAISMAFEVLQKMIRPGSEGLLPVGFGGGNAANIIPAEATLFVESEKSQEELQEMFAPIRIEEARLETPIRNPEIFAAALEFHQRVEEMAVQIEKRTNADFTPPHDTTAPTQVFPGPKELDQGGDLILIQDYRFINPGAGKWFFEQLKELGKGLSELYPDVIVDVEIERLNDPMVGDRESAWVKDVQKIVHSMDLPGNLATKCGCTEGAVFADAGIETIVLGPGRAENNIHKPNEKVSVQKLHQTVDFFEKLFEQFCF